uniref:Uncharacterized protein n=1 Tax=Picea sitchensis TaxID=3332 RepID=A9NL19_PICSI|nr:unknown [Picea sitchensis]
MALGKSVQRAGGNRVILLPGLKRQGRRRKILLRCLLKTALEICQRMPSKGMMGRSLRR